MARRVDVRELVGTAEIAERLGVKRPQVIHDWRRRHDAFPAPVTSVSGVHVWLWRDVERWARETGRLPKPSRG